MTGYGRLGVELGGVRSVHAGDVARKLDHGHLHPEADAEERDLLLARRLRGPDLALDPPLAEPARDQDPIRRLERRLIEVLRVDQLHLDVDPVVVATVAERLDHRLVGVGELHVLADQGDPNRPLAGVGAPHQLLPLPQLRRLRVEAEMVEHQVVHPLRAEHQRHLVDVVHVASRDHRLLRHAAEERDLAANLALQPALRPADDRLGLDPDPPQLVDRVLRRLGLQLAGVADVGHQGQVHEHAALRPQVRVELADRLQEGQRLDVAHRAADLRDHEVDRLGLGQDQDPLLDLVGDVGNHLDGRAEVVAAALAPDHRVVDRARR